MRPYFLRSKRLFTGLRLFNQSSDLGRFVRVNNQLIDTINISKVDASEIEQLILVLHLTDQSSLVVQGFEALEVAYRLDPNLLEGKRLMFEKGTWLVHNMVAHPLMHVLALMGKHKLAFWVHDATIPRALGAKNQRK